MKGPDEDALPASAGRCRIYYLNEWRGHGRRRLYLKDYHGMQLGTFKLGYVDLATNDLRPSIRGPLSQDHQPAEYYLRLLRDRQPPAR